MICEAVFLFNTWDVRSSLFVCWIYSSLTGKCRVCLVNRFLQWSAGSKLEQLLTSYSLAHSTQYSWSKVCENSSFSSSNFVFMHFLFAGFFLCLLLSIFFCLFARYSLESKNKTQQWASICKHHLRGFRRTRFSLIVSFRSGVIADVIACVISSFRHVLSSASVNLSWYFFPTCSRRVSASRTLATPCTPLTGHHPRLLPAFAHSQRPFLLTLLNVAFYFAREITRPQRKAPVSLV